MEYLGEDLNGTNQQSADRQSCHKALVGWQNVKAPLASYIQADKNTGLGSGNKMPRSIRICEINS